MAKKTTKTEETKKADPKRQQYVACCAELNATLIDEEHAVDLTAPIKTLKSKIKQAADLIGKKDCFTQSTWDVLVEVAGVAAPKKKQILAESVEDEEEAEETDEEAEEEAEEKPAKGKSKGKSKAAEEKPAKSSKSSKSEGSGSPIKKVGIVATIVEVIQKSGKKGATKEEILQELVARFPDRASEPMKRTVSTQVPARIHKEKFELQTLEGGRYRVADGSAAPAPAKGKKKAKAEEPAEEPKAKSTKGKKKAEKSAAEEKPAKGKSKGKKAKDTAEEKPAKSTKGKAKKKAKSK